MLTTDFDKILLALKHIKTINEKWSLIEKEIGLLIASNKFDNTSGLVLFYSGLHEILDRHSIHIELDGQAADAKGPILAQYLCIHYYILQDKVNLNSHNQIQDFIERHQPLKTILNRWKDESKVIIYQDHLGLYSWNEFVASSSWDWTEITLLDESILYCNISCEALFEYMSSVSSNHPNDLAVPRLGKNIVAKIKKDKTLKHQIELNIQTIITNSPLNLFLPSFLQGLIGSEQEFERWFDELKKHYGLSTPFKLLYAIGTACPDGPQSLEFFKNEIKENLTSGLLSTSEAVQLYAIKNFSSADVLAFLIDTASFSVKEEDTKALLNFLWNNLEMEYQSEWFRTILFHSARHGHRDSLDLLSNLLHELLQKDITFAYQIIGTRFEHLGADYFLKHLWGDLVKADRNLFLTNLTGWLNSDNRNVHRALLKLCSIRQISPSNFKLSSVVMNSLSQKDKLYIAIKIVGYIYAKDSLQSLMFSLVEFIKKDETVLYENVYRLFSDYVIYNYRTSLDTIKEILKLKQLPAHLLKFFRDLDQDYEQYFKELSIIEALPELQPNPLLVRHLQFYQQHQYTEKFKETSKSGLAAFFKNVPVHSHRWAIRRPDEPIHQPSPMGLIETSVEFPSGERLDPVQQENIRRTYQRMKRNEININ